MLVYYTSDFDLAFKDLMKPKYLNTYGTLKEEITDFFKEYPAFDQVWSKSYMLFESSFIRVNKVRLENKNQNSGKSGGFRLIVLCDSRTRLVALLYVYPKTGRKGKDSISLEFSKKLVKNYSKASKQGLLQKFNLKS